MVFSTSDYISANLEEDPRVSHITILLINYELYYIAFYIDDFLKIFTSNGVELKGIEKSNWINKNKIYI